MQARTYGNIEDFERRIYHLGDLNLPLPVPLVATLWAAAAGVPWAMLLNYLGLPFSRGLPSVIYLVPPGVLGWLSTQPLLDSKSLLDWALTVPRIARQLTATRARAPRTVSVRGALRVDRGDA